MSTSETTVTEEVETSACPLRKGNTRIYYVPKDQVAPVVHGMLQRSVIDLTGTVNPSGPISAGDYVLVWLPDCVGFCGFLRVRSSRQAGESVSFEVVKTFKAVKSKAIVELRGLAFNPSIFTAGFGKLVADMNDCKRGARYPYDPDSVLTVLTDLWDKAELPGNRFARPHMPQPARSTVAASSQSLQQQPAKKRKKSHETKQLNRDLLLRELTATGMSGERAAQILDNESAGWGVTVLTGNEDQLDLTIQVFRPGHTAPVITAPFETVYKEVAKLWKVEFDSPKPRPVAKPTRYTRQQERAAAALEQRLQTEGLNEVQKQQMRDMIAEALRPLADNQQQDRSRMEKIEHTQSDHDSSFKQIVPVLQQMAAAWTQHQYALPAPMYTAPSMPIMAAQPPTQQPVQHHRQQPLQDATSLPGSQSGQSHAQPRSPDAMQSAASNSAAQHHHQQQQQQQANSADR